MVTKMLHNSQMNFGLFLLAGTVGVKMVCGFAGAKVRRADE